MCGIGGFCDLTRDNRQWKWEKTGERMCRTLERRGPDDGGTWVGEDCVLAHYYVTRKKQELHPLTRRYIEELKKMFGDL